jgi:hypothetical protein
MALCNQRGGFGEGRPVCTLHPKGHSPLRFHFFSLEVETRNEAGGLSAALFLSEREEE